MNPNTPSREDLFEYICFLYKRNEALTTRVEALEVRPATEIISLEQQNKLLVTLNDCNDHLSSELVSVRAEFKQVLEEKEKAKDEKAYHQHLAARLCEESKMMSNEMKSLKEEFMQKIEEMKKMREEDEKKQMAEWRSLKEIMELKQINYDQQQQIMSLKLQLNEAKNGVEKMLDLLKAPATESDNVLKATVELKLMEATAKNQNSLLSMNAVKDYNSTGVLQKYLVIGTLPRYLFASSDKIHYLPLHNTAKSVRLNKSDVAGYQKELLITINGEKDYSESNPQVLINQEGNHQKLISLCQQWKKLRPDGEIHCLYHIRSCKSTMVLPEQAISLFTTCISYEIGDDRYFLKDMASIRKYWPKFYKNVLSTYSLY